MICDMKIFILFFFSVKLIRYFLMSSLFFFRHILSENGSHKNNLGHSVSNLYNSSFNLYLFLIYIFHPILIAFFYIIFIILTIFVVLSFFFLSPKV